MGFRMKLTHTLTACVLALALVSAVAAQQDAKKTPPKSVLPPAPEGVMIQTDIAYLAPGRAETADLYLPAKLDPPGPYGEFSCRVQCAVDMYGPADLTSRDDVVMLGKKRAEAPELYRAASPTTYVDRSDPPILILHGTADKTVDVKQSELFAA